jgi:hypothetical protein
MLRVVRDGGGTPPCARESAQEQLVVPGLHGKPLRVLRVPVADAITFQRHVCAGLNADDLTSWIKIAKSYLERRSRVEVPLG